jgi:predicted dehydrogenase
MTEDDVGMTLRWGFLGASRIGQRALAPAIAAADGHALVAVAAREPSRARDYAAALAIPEVLASYDRLIASDRIDIVYNALPNDLHAAWTIRALEAGKHVLCEKPLTMNAAEAEAIAAAKRRTGRLVLEAFCQIHHPQFAAARAAMARIGAPVAVQAYFGATLGNPGDYRWLARHGGGAMYDLGCYCVSTTRLLLGREPVRATAVQAMQGEVDASFAGMLDFGDGLAAQFACSFVSAFTQRLEIVGSDGRLEFDWPFSTKGRETHLTVNGATESFPPGDPYEAMVRHFGAAIRDGAPLLHPVTGAVAQARAMDALRRAAQCGSSVSL